jgi:Flp pilus assembly protein TadG
MGLAGKGGDVTVIVTLSDQAEAPEDRGQYGRVVRRMSQPRGYVRPRPWRAPSGSGDGDRGSLTLFLVVLFAGLLALAGIVVDGGGKLAAAENAASFAQEAARAGAGIVSQSTAYANGSFVVDDGQAVTVAQQFLTTVQQQGTVTANGNSIEVTVTITKPTKVLSLIGIKSYTVTGQATATLQSGVTGPGQ